MRSKAFVPAASLVLYPLCLRPAPLKRAHKEPQKEDAGGIMSRAAWWTPQDPHTTTLGNAAVQQMGPASRSHVWCQEDAPASSNRKDGARLSYFFPCCGGVPFGPHSAAKKVGQHSWLPTGWGKEHGCNPAPFGCIGIGGPGAHFPGPHGHPCSQMRALWAWTPGAKPPGGGGPA